MATADIPLFQDGEPPDNTQLPDHADDVAFVPDWEPPPNGMQLPDKDGAIVINFAEHPQNRLLTGSIEPRLNKLHPDGQYCIGCDTGIFWRHTRPPLLGCKAPDWFYVPNVAPTWGGKPRRSFVLWEDGAAPLVILEYVSGDGSEEYDPTPLTGKFWVYERGIRVPYYAIHDHWRGTLAVFQLAGDRFQPVPPNERGHFPIPPLELELGIWQGQYANMDLPWLRWWDAQGNLLPSLEERADQERQRADQEQQRADQERQRGEQERQRAERLAERLRALGVDPEKEEGTRQ